MKGYIYEIEHEKKDELEEHAEQILHHAGKLMQGLQDLVGEAGSMGNRIGYRRGIKGTGRYGMRMGRREPIEDMDDESYIDQAKPGMMGYRDPYYNFLQDISLTAGINPYGEEISYISGEFIRSVYDKAKNLLCECCRKRVSLKSTRKTYKHLI